MKKSCLVEMEEARPGSTSKYRSKELLILAMSDDRTWLRKQFFGHLNWMLNIGREGWLDAYYAIDYRAKLLFSAGGFVLRWSIRRWWDNDFNVKYYNSADFNGYVLETKPDEAERKLPAYKRVERTRRRLLAGK